MTNNLLESLVGIESEARHYAIAPGIVTNNLDLLAEGRVQVRIPSCPGWSPLARLVGLGGGDGRGFFWVPQVDDEVLVAFSQDDERDAYILGGMWSMTKRPPVVDPFSQSMTRVIKTGASAPGVGALPSVSQEIEFDDFMQSVTIKNSIGHKISVGPSGVKMQSMGEVVSINVNLLDVPPTITIESKTGNIELKAPLGKISLNALQVEIKGTAKTDLKSDGLCTVEGKLVKIN